MMSHVNTTKILEEIDKLQVEDQSLNHLSTSKIVMDNKKKTLSIPNPTPSRSFRAKNKKSVFDELEDIEEESDEFDSEDKQPSNSKAPVFDYSKSRYTQEFEPMQLLGNGASGEVWKVKHKLDQKIYAVKKINLNYKNNSLRHKIQREVTTISSLFHKNIVRYYAAWIEQYEEILPVESGDNPKSSSKTASTSNMGKEKFISNTESKGNSSNAWLTGNPFAKEAEKELDRNNFALNDYSILFSEGNDGSSGKDINLGVSSGFGFKPTRYSHIYNYGNSSSSDDSSSSSEEESSDSSESSVSEKSKEESQGDRKRNSDWLFIQMEYCYTTLRAFIDETELWKRPVEVKRLFREMLEALAYVHDRKVIHRDLKVSFFLNILGYLIFIYL
jgi:translation initiation factor 2-alpha kinase 4